MNRFVPLMEQINIAHPVPGCSMVEHSVVNDTAGHHKPLFWRRLAITLSAQLCPTHFPRSTITIDEKAALSKRPGNRWLASEHVLRPAILNGAMSRTSQCFLRDGENDPPGGVEVICEMLQDQAVVRQEIDVNVGVIGILSFSRFLDHAERPQFRLVHTFAPFNVFPRERSECFSDAEIATWDSSALRNASCVQRSTASSR
jgi:hypothetical protein